MLPNEIKIGPLTLHFYGLIIAIAIYAGWFLAKKRAHLYKIPKSILDDPVLLIPLFLAIAGARLYHVIDYWNLYRYDLLSALFVNRGGLGIWGALVGAVVGFFLAAKIKKIDFSKVLDLAAPSLLIGQVIGRFANYINQEAFGPPTRLPWAIFIKEENRPSQFKQFTNFHPTFFYEAAIDAILLITLLYLEKRLKRKGQVFALYLIFYSIGRFIVEFWRIDTATVNGVKVSYVLSFTTFLLGLILFTRFRRLDKN